MATDELRHGTVTAERRVITVLFADLVGFTGLAEAPDPEDVATVQDAYFAHAADAIGRNGGRVEKYIGDAVVGVFGVPSGTDDDAVGAVRAVVEIVDAVAGLAASLPLQPEALRVRVGVHTGEVVVTYLDERNDSWRLTGDTMNVAARLQSVAEPGTVLVGAPTALAAETMFVLEPAGTPALKGIPSRSPRGGSSARARSPAARPHSTCPSWRPSAGTSSWPVWRPGWPGASWLVIAPPGRR